MNVRRFSGLVFLLITFFKSYSQDIHSDIAWYESFFQEGGHPLAEKSLAIAAARLEESFEIQDMPVVVRTLNELGLLNLTRVHDNEKAMDFFIRALAIEDSLNMYEQKAFTYMGIAQVFEIVGDYEKSSQFLEQALELKGVQANTKLRARILNKLGKTYVTMGRREEAFDFYELVLGLGDEMDDPPVEAEALFNQAHLYSSQGDYTEALIRHRDALTIRRAEKDRRNEAVSLNDIGELYRLMKNDERALANHVAALEIRQSLKDKSGVAESYNNIGVLYYHQKNFQKAVANLMLALEAGRELQTQEQIRKSADYLTQCYKEIGDFKKALEYKELYTNINDFIQNERNDRQLQETQSRYVIERSEAQIEGLESIRIQREKEIAEQKLFRNVLVALIGFGVVIVILVLYLYFLKQKSNRILKAAHEQVHLQNIELQNLNATKDKFFSIISHDLKGPLNSLISFSGLLINHADSLSKEEIQMLAKDLDKSLKNLFALLENLLEWSRSQTGNIEFDPEPFDLASTLEQNKDLLLQQAQSKNITLVNAIATGVPVSAHKNSINTVIRNLISNAIKFTPQGGRISMGVKANGKEWIVSIADNGVGMSPDVVEKIFRIDTRHTTKGTANEKGTGLGLILCKDFVEKNGGRIWVESEIGKGSVFYFSLPKT
ncbi:MAG TPA: tetratricopeptide repeat-containing sensor histidine kinase [Ohtaekwangia sp.]